METPTIHNSVVLFLNYHGIKSDHKSRAAFATLFGIQGYTGTAEQNIYLHKKLKEFLGSVNAPTPIYEMAENLWQTLNAVRVLASMGLPLDDETKKVIQDCLKANNPTIHQPKLKK